MSAYDISIRLEASVSPRSTCSISACSRRRSRSAISWITRRRSAVWASSSSRASETAAVAERSSSSRQPGARSALLVRGRDERRCFCLDPSLRVLRSAASGAARAAAALCRGLCCARSRSSPQVHSAASQPGAAADQQCLRELHTRSAFALEQVAPTLVCDLPFLLDEARTSASARILARRDFSSSAADAVSSATSACELLERLIR